MINKFLFHNGGSETYIFKLGDYLVKMGHEVQYFGMDHPNRCVGNRINLYVSEMDFHTKSLFKKIRYSLKIIYSIEARKKIRKILEDFKPDVCHINNFNYQLTPSIILEIKKWNKKCKIIYTAHDFQLLCPNHMFYNSSVSKICEKCLDGKYFNCVKYKCIHGSFVKSIIGAVEAKIWNNVGIYKNIDNIICCSRFMKKKFDTNVLYSKKTIAIHNFIDRKMFSHIKNIKEKNYVLYFGRYSKEKGIETLLDVCKSLPNIKFIFAGKGILETKINEIPNIINAGYKMGNELEKLIKNAKFTICPSEWYENCPYSIMESQSLGIPVLGAKIGGIPELIINGENGELFESGNKIQLKNKIIKMFNSNKNTILSKKKLNFYTVKEYYEKIYNIYTNNNLIIEK